MEVDSIHKRVEDAKKSTSIFIPSQWDTVIQMARKKDPYTVIPMRHTDFIDLKTLSSNSVGKRDGVSWLDIRWIRYLKSDPDTFFYKFSFEEDFRSIALSAPPSGRRGRRRMTAATFGPTSLYSEKLAISSQKKKDLMDLCRLQIIPEDHHSYYRELPCNDSIQDNLLLTDQEESDGDDRGIQM